MRASNGKRVAGEIRSREWNLRVIFIFAVLILIAVISGRHFTLLDAILTQHEPFRTDFNGPLTQPGFVHISDNVTQIIPGKLFTQEELKAGRLPLWNPHIFCGMPHIADLHSQVFSITDTPFLLLMPVDDALGAAALLKLLLAGYFMYLFCRHLWIDRRLALAAGALYAMSSFTLAWLHFPSFLSTTLYYPLGLMLWDTYLTQLDKRLRRRSQIWLGIVMGLMILGGQLQLFANFILIALVYGLFSGRGAYKGSRWRLLLGLLPPLAIGLAVGAIQLAPAIELMLHSTRAAGEEFNLITDIKAMWGQPALLLSVLGNLLFKVVSIAAPFGWSRIIPTNAQPFPEAVIYVGVTVLLCFVAPLRGLRGAFNRFLFKYVLVLIIINIFSLVLNSLFSFVGMLEFLNPGRCAISAAVLLLPLLAVRRLDSFHKGEISLDEAINAKFFGRSEKIFALIILVPFFALLFLALIEPPGYVMNFLAGGFVAWIGMIFYIMEFFILALLYNYLRRAGKIVGRDLTIEAISAAMIAEALLLTAVLAFPGAALTTEKIRDNSLSRAFAYEQEPFRVVRYQPFNPKDLSHPAMLVKRRSPILKPNEGMLIGIDDFQGYNSLNPKAFSDYVKRIDKNLVMNLRGSIDLFSIDQVSAVELDKANVRYVLSEVPIDSPGLERILDDPVKVYRRLTAQPRFGFTASGEEEAVKRWDYHAGYLMADYSSSRQAEFYFSENYFPGWQVYVDGKKAEIRQYADTPFMAVDAPAGEHRIIFTYEPFAVKLGFAFTLAGFLFAFLFWLLTSRRVFFARRKGSSPRGGIS